MTEARVIRIWASCYRARSAVLSSEQIDMASQWSGDIPYCAFMIRATLATRDSGLIRIKGVEQRIAYLLEASEHGKESARARKEKFGSAQPAKNAPEGSPKVPSTDLEGSSNGPSDPLEPLPLDLPLPLSPDQKEEEEEEEQISGLGPFDRLTVDLAINRAPTSSSKSPNCLFGGDPIVVEFLEDIPMRGQECWAKGYGDKIWIEAELKQCAIKWETEGPKDLRTPKVKYINNWLQNAQKKRAEMPQVQSESQTRGTGATPQAPNYQTGYLANRIEPPPPTPEELERIKKHRQEFRAKLGLGES